MGKSNKFDYTKRGSSGAKLGHIISRDLKKEVDRATRDAEKASSKTRKRSTGSNSSGARDVTAHTLDLQVPFKELGDEGLCAMTEGLEIALSQGSVLLEDVNLSGNGITTASLARLAPIIKLAHLDLKTLDLRANKIRVETVDQAVQWETFLQAFRSCRKLRRVDFSENAKLGAKAFEIMAKVHVNEPPISAMPYRGNTSVISLHADEETIAAIQPRYSADSMSRGGHLKRRMGLRSIPYITLTDTGLDDLSALWLSLILEEHYYPNQLIDRLNATSASSSIATYQQDASSRGVDWNMENPNENRDGLYLLQKTEIFRKQIMVEDEAFDDLQDGDDNSMMAQLDERRASRALPGDRRASVRSIQTVDGGEHELSELESARKRLQRTLLTKYGASKVELWRTALRILISRRVVQGIGPGVKISCMGLHKEPSRFDFASHSATITADKIASAPRSATPSNKPFLNSAMSSPTTPSRQQGSYAASLTSSHVSFSETGIAMSDGTNLSRTPLVQVLKPHRKGAEAATKPNSLATRGKDWQRYMDWQEDHIKKREEESKLFRDVKNLSNLPNDLLDFIAGLTVTEREKQLLSEKQLRAALSWGQRRDHFTTEREWLKMADSSQTWTLLENIGCLVYDRY